MTKGIFKRSTVDYYWTTDSIEISFIIITNKFIKIEYKRCRQWIK